jgi:hypothetical protein
MSAVSESKSNGMYHMKLNDTCSKIHIGKHLLQSAVLTVSMLVLWVATLFGIAGRDANISEEHTASILSPEVFQKQNSQSYSLCFFCSDPNLKYSVLDTACNGDYFLTH